MSLGRKLPSLLEWQEGQSKWPSEKLKKYPRAVNLILRGKHIAYQTEVSKEEI